VNGMDNVERFMKRMAAAETGAELARRMTSSNWLTRRGSVRWQCVSIMTKTSHRKHWACDE